MTVTFGCFTRPWNQCDLDTALREAKKAGSETVGLMRMQGEALVDHATSPADAEAVRRAVEASGLDHVSVIGGADCKLPRDEAATQFRAFLDRVRDSGATSALVCGVKGEGNYERYYDLMRDGAAHAAEIGIRIALKPHGGISATAADCVRALDAVDHEAFVIWYDPGNIIYYTGGDPSEDVKALAGRVAGMCVKDCVGGEKGSVTVTPGDGAVDFEAVLDVLLDAGFDGPLVLECCGGETTDEITREAARGLDHVRRIVEG